MIHVESFQAEDWFMDDPIEDIEATEETIIDLVTMGMGFTVFDDDKVLACGGLIFWKEGESEAWIRLDKGLFENSTRAVRAIVEAARIVLDVYDGYVYCWVDDDEPIYQRFVYWFGYKKRAEIQKKDGKIYRMWEFDRGINIYDSRGSRQCRRGNAASQDGQVTSGSSSKDK